MLPAYHSLTAGPFWQHLGHDPGEVRQSFLDEHRRFFDALLAAAIGRGEDSYSISTAHLKYGRVYDLLTHPRIVACVADLLGENVVGWGSHYFCKMPHDGKSVTWHQDASYWPLSPSHTASYSGNSRR